MARRKSKITLTAVASPGEPNEDPAACGMDRPRGRGEAPTRVHIGDISGHVYLLLTADKY